MSSKSTTRVTILLAVLLLLVYAGAARAQLAVCVDPETVPAAVLESIISTGFLFGELSQKACNDITRKGVNGCKKQVRAAAKCRDQEISLDASIALKQCKQLDSSGDRKDCKQLTKANKKALSIEVDQSRSSGLDQCESDFEETLLGSCLIGLPG